MSISIKCAECGKVYHVAEDNAGRRLQCKVCRGLMQVPHAAPRGERVRSQPPIVGRSSGKPSEESKHPAPISKRWVLGAAAGLVSIGLIVCVYLVVGGGQDGDSQGPNASRRTVASDAGVGRLPVSKESAAHVSANALIDKASADSLNRDSPDSLGAASDRDARGSAEVTANSQEFEAVLRKARSLVSTDGSWDEFHESMRSVADAFPEVQVGTDSANVQWNTVSLNSHGIGFDAIRFSSPLDQPADFRWCFVIPNGLNTWFIMPRQGRMKGFTGFDEREDMVLDDFELPTNNRVCFQSLEGGEIKPGQEYLLWFYFKSEQPTDLHVAINLSPTGTTPAASTAAEIAQAIGLD